MRPQVIIATTVWTRVLSVGTVHGGAEERGVSALRQSVHPASGAMVHWRVHNGGASPTAKLHLTVH